MTIQYHKKNFSHFLLKFFRFKNQLLWEQHDQAAYIHFPQVLTELELLPYVNIEANKHLHYRDPTSLNISQLELINLDNQFLVENFEVSDNRPYRSTNITLKYFQHNLILIICNRFSNKIFSLRMTI